MAHLNVKLSQKQLDALRRYAVRRRTPISWLNKDYVDFLLAGGQPVTPPTDEEETANELAEYAQQGGAFD